MTVLLCFGDRILSYPGIAEVFAHRSGDLRRSDKVSRRNMEVAVVLEHSRIYDLRCADAVEFVEVVSRLESLRYLDRAVSAEVEEDHGVTVVDRSDGLAVLGDNERIEILIDRARFLAVGLYSLFGGSKHSSLAEHMGLPSELNHMPICFVTIHCDLHASAARRDLYVEIIRAERIEISFKGNDIIECGGLSDITTVEKYMNADTAHALLLGFVDHSLEMINVGMHVAVGEKSEKMKRAAVFRRGNNLLPRIGGEHFSRFDRLRDKLCALREHLTRAERVMSDLGISHIVIGRKSDRGAVSLELYSRVLGHQHIERRRICLRNGVALSLRSKPDTVHDYRKNRT